MNRQINFICAQLHNLYVDLYDAEQSLDTRWQIDITANIDQLKCELFAMTGVSCPYEALHRGYCA